MAERGTCPRCGAPVEFYGTRRVLRDNATAEVDEGARIRAHKDPTQGRSCFAGGKLYADIMAAQEAWRARRVVAHERVAERNSQTDRLIEP